MINTTTLSDISGAVMLGDDKIIPGDKVMLADLVSGTFYSDRELQDTFGGIPIIYAPKGSNADLRLSVSGATVNFTGTYMVNVMSN